MKRRQKQSHVRGLHVGCGPHVLSGWLNVDNSPTLLLRYLPVGRILHPGRRALWEAARTGQIRWARATRLPLPDASVDTVYTSHMVEHLRQSEARKFLLECRRVLRPGGWLRISVPDLRMLASDYLADGDANRFVGRLMLTYGRRGHHWMYDGSSLCRLVEAAGFPEPVVMAAGETNLVFRNGLDLSERGDESVYVEAQQPIDERVGLLQTSSQS